MRFDCVGSQSARLRSGLCLGSGIFLKISISSGFCEMLTCVATAQARTTCMSAFWVVRVLGSFWDARRLAQSISLRSTSCLLFSRFLLLPEPSTRYVALAHSVFMNQFAQTCLERASEQAKTFVACSIGRNALSMIQSTYSRTCFSHV